MKHGETEIAILAHPHEKFNQCLTDINWCLTDLLKI